jgi:hypothetical protein
MGSGGGVAVGEKANQRRLTTFRNRLRERFTKNVGEERIIFTI